MHYAKAGVTSWFGQRLLRLPGGMRERIGGKMCDIHCMDQPCPASVLDNMGTYTLTGVVPPAVIIRPSCVRDKPLQNAFVVVDTF